MELIKKLNKFVKIFFINFIILTIFLLIIELTFGFWFDPNNLGPYVREYRMRKNTYVVKYEGNIYQFEYKRNYYGFRGDEVPLDQISAVIVGGSTADERYKPDKFTITELLNNKIKQKIKNIKIYNAGIEGQSTRGHLSNLRFWFPRLKGFKPKYIIYYIGINDQFITSIEDNVYDGVVLDPSSKQRFFDNIKSRSFFYDQIRKIKHRLYNSEVKLEYNFDSSIEKFKDKKIEFLNYDNFIKKNSLDIIFKQITSAQLNYLKRVDKLYEETNKIGSIPIFINQLTAEGYNNLKLASLNIILIDHCIKKNYLCIDLASKLNGKPEFWWDGVHTTPKGSEEIASILAPELIKYFLGN